MNTNIIINNNKVFIPVRPFLHAIGKVIIIAFSVQSLRGTDADFDDILMRSKIRLRISAQKS